MFLKVENSHIQDSNHDAWMYNLDNNLFNIAGVNLTGPYPDQGKQAVNNQSDSIFMVLEGSASIKVDKKDSYKLFKGDIYFVPKGVGYCLKPYMCEEVKFWIVSSPPFSPAQQHIID